MAIIKTSDCSKRRVEFCATHDVKVVKVISRDEKNSVWYTREELQTLRSLCTTESDQIKLNSSYEMFCCKSSDRRRQKEFVVGLLQQQLEHKKMGVIDPKGLYQLSKASSKKSRQEALKYAREQEKEVKEYMSQKEEVLGVLDDVLDLLAN